MKAYVTIVNGMIAVADVESAAVRQTHEMLSSISFNATKDAIENGEVIRTVKLRMAYVTVNQ
jgi:hypothetical protein